MNTMQSLRIKTKLLKPKHIKIDPNLYASVAVDFDKAMEEIIQKNEQGRWVIDDTAFATLQKPIRRAKDQYLSLFFYTKSSRTAGAVHILGYEEVKE